MNWYDAMEEAYKHGYDQGLKDAQKNVRHGEWLIRSSGKGDHANNWVECSYCHVVGSPMWKVCPVCETKMVTVPLDDTPPDGTKTIEIKQFKMDMDVEPKPSCNRCANDGMDVPQCDECPGSGFKWFREKM